MKSYFSIYFSDDEELNSFGEWAFGEDFLEIDNGPKFVECWNYHHGKELNLSSECIVSEDAPKMVKLWKERK